VELDPNDGNALDFHGAISLFSGRFEEALKASDRKHIQGGSNQRFANRNIFAAASFHLGDMQKCVEAFREATQFGDPLSAPSLAYQAAALDTLGRRQAALEKLGELNRAWPETRLDEIFYGIYKNRADADVVLDHLRALGWVSPSKRALAE
jgi:tetratricopeptide (TPR) repeat protein